MKKIVFACLLALLGLSASAQDPAYYRFLVKEGYVTWQLVYESSVDTEVVQDYLLSSGDFSEVAEVAGGFSFTISPRFADWRSSDVARAHVPLYILNYQMSAHCLLQIREGRYRVTVDHVVFLDDPPTPLETYALNRRGEFRGVFTASSSNAAAVLDHDFEKLFTITAGEEEEDW